MKVSGRLWGEGIQGYPGHPLTHCDRAQAAGIVLSSKSNEVGGIGRASLSSAALQPEGRVSLPVLDQQEVPQPIEGIIGIIQGDDVGVPKCPG